MTRVPRAALGICALMSGVVAAAFGLVPAFLVVAYLALSALSYLMYRFDKNAAQSDARRTPEASLHLVDLLGGWPGALIAQQQFRHKTSKPSFQLAFWATVVVNVVAATWIYQSGVLAASAARLAS